MYTDLFDAETNLQVGAWVLSRGLAEGKDFDSPERYALVEFKAGRAKAQEWAGDSRSAAELLQHADVSTREFVEAVFRRWKFYRVHGW